MNAANAISLLGLCAGLAAALLAVQGHLAWALSALAAAGLCDVFDGFVARKLKRTPEQETFGQRLDSLVDACVFCAAPTLVLYGAGLRTLPEMIGLGVFVCCGVWRLAYFDTVGLAEPAEGGRRYYTGLPTTFVALAIPLACLAGLHSVGALRIAANAVGIGLAIAFVAPFPFPKPGAREYVPLALLGLIVLGGYAFLGLTDRFPVSAP